MDQRLGAPSSEAPAAYEENISLLEQYLLDGVPMDREALVALLKEPDVVADELVGDGRIATMITAKAVEAGGGVPDIRERYDKVQALLTMARERGHGDSDYMGATATAFQVNGKQDAQGRRRHRKVTG